MDDKGCLQTKSVYTTKLNIINKPKDNYSSTYSRVHPLILKGAHSVSLYVEFLLMYVYVLSYSIIILYTNHVAFFCTPPFFLNKRLVIVGSY